MTRKKQSLTDESIVEENEQKTSLNSSRRSSILTSRSPSKEKKSPNSVRKSSTEGNELTDTSSPGSSASALARKSRLRRSPTMKSNKGKEIRLSRIESDIDIRLSFEASSLVFFLFPYLTF